MVCSSITRLKEYIFYFIYDNHGGVLICGYVVF